MLKRRFINKAGVLFLALTAIAGFFFHTSWWWSGAVLFIWFWITLLGSFLIRWNYHLKAIHSNKKIQDNWVSITFDDGPNVDITPKVLQLLDAYNAKATFFCIGKQAKAHPQLLKEIVAKGHTLGNHTYSHARSFGFLGTQQVMDELRKTNDLIEKITGLKMRLYRPCFAVTNPQIEKAVAQLGLHVIGWNVRSLDTTPRPASMVLKRITSKTSKGDVILLHDTSEKSVAVLEQLLLFLQENNLRSVPVDRLLQRNAYAK